MKIINDLSHDPGPVYRIDCYQLRLAVKEGLIAKAGFDHPLTIIKVTLDGEVVNIIALHSRHLATLHLRHTFMRMQYKDVNVLAPTAAFDRCRPGIT